MASSILVVCCPSDIPRQYGYFYLKQFAQYAVDLGHRVVFLRNAYLSNLGDALIKYDPHFVVMQGHGGAKGITGCGDHVILGVKTFDKELNTKLNEENPEWMAGRIVFLWSCFSGRELAPALVSRGAEAVAGFMSAYIFLTENFPNGIARQFIDPVIIIPNMLAEGYTFGEASKTFRTVLNANVERAEARGDELSAKYLNHNLVNFTALGDMGARL